MARVVRLTGIPSESKGDSAASSRSPPTLGAVRLSSSLKPRKALCVRTVRPRRFTSTEILWYRTVFPGLANVPASGT